tara:strand:- start:65 stop:598 length:534 start_codon:yes stop_codon:yes gene_type:complete
MKFNINKFLSLSLFFVATAFISKEALSDHHNYEFTPEKPYYVIPNPDGEGSEKEAINKKSYYGYRIFHQNCHVCHGKAARGSSFAPNLLEAYNHAKGGNKTGNGQVYESTYEWFLDTVVNGYKREMAGGTVNVMPQHGDVLDVMNNIDGIYGYIAAMAEGKLKTRDRPGKGWKIPAK